MSLHEFGLEILVRGQPLLGYNLPISESNLKNTSLSYIVDPLTQTKKYSDFITYVPVMIPEERYTIRFDAKQATSSNIIISRIYIDGQSDRVQHLHQQQSRTRSFFCNNERTKIYYFKFSKTFDKKKDISNSPFKVPYPVNKKPLIQQQQTTYGKPGSVTVCFFKGIVVDQNSSQNKSEFEVKQVKLAETTDDDNTEIGYVTGFDTRKAKIQPSTVTKVVNSNPIAVLHLHYRSVDWFTDKKIPLQHLSFPNQDLKPDVIVMDDDDDDDDQDFQIMLIEDNNNVEQKLAEHHDDKVEKEPQNNNNVEQKLEHENKIEKESQHSNNVEQKQEENEVIILQQNILKRSFNEINTDILGEKECGGNALKKLCIE